MSKPKTRAEMVEYMARIGLSEGVDFHAVIVENGWAATEEEARLYLEALGITPWED